MSHLDAKNYGNRKRLRGKHMRTGPLADVIREIGSPGLSTLSASYKHTDFEAAASTDTVSLPRLPKDAEIIKVMIDLKADFTAGGGGGANTTLSLGSPDGAADICGAVEVQAVGGITVARHPWVLDADEGADEADVTVSNRELKITMTRAGSTCSLLTAGSFSVCVLYAVMPT